jgi:hypothetical protein
LGTELIVNIGHLDAKRNGANEQHWKALNGWYIQGQQNQTPQLAQNWKTQPIEHQLGLGWQSQWQELEQHLQEFQLMTIEKWWSK